MKYVVWALILFAGYSGWKLFPIAMTKSSVARSVERELGGIHDGLSDEVLRKRIIRSANVASVKLDPEKIWIERERRTGERIFRIDIEVPITYDYLGSERTSISMVHIDQAVPVDEAAELRRVAAKKRFDDRVSRISAANDKLVGAIRRCEQETGGPCGVPGGGGARMAPDEIEIIEAWRD